IMGELKKVFRPEFLNRIDEVIVFHKLTKEEVREIVDLLLRRIRESMAERELSLNLSDGAKDLLAEKGWDPAMGARPLRRAIQRYVEDPLADEVLKAADMQPGATVDIDRKKGDPAKDGEKEGEDELRITIHAPKREREAVGVGAKGGGPDAPSGEGDGDSGDDGGDNLPDEPEVLPDVPDAPPADDGDSKPE
ncbi:MAG: NDP-hexose 4-ketoreductase, partial [Thermoleophilaceae bacterium]